MNGRMINATDFFFSEMRRLEQLQQLLYVEQFRSVLEKASPSKSGTRKGGTPSVDCVMMCKVILFGKTVNVSDDQLEYHIFDRLSFQTFLNLTLEDKALSDEEKRRIDEE
jgi:IS5 family transposase